MALKIISGIVIVTLATAGIYWSSEKKRQKIEKSHTKENHVSRERKNTSVQTLQEGIDDSTEYYAKEKDDVLESIKTRHKEAAKELRSSLEHIVDAKTIEKTHNTEILDEMLNDINKLMQ